MFFIDLHKSCQSDSDTKHLAMKIGKTLASEYGPMIANAITPTTGETCSGRLNSEKVQYESGEREEGRVSTD